MTNLLTFGKGNAKLTKNIATFSLPAGFACPGALECLSKANRDTGKITDGPETKFRCFSASAESAYKNVRESRWSNFDTLKGKSKETLVSLINASLPKEPIVRIHVSGDFFSQAYFDAWVEVAKATPEKLFYAYTKSLNFWVARLGNLPANFKLTASRGGRYDALIEAYKLKCAEVVFTEEQAAEKGLAIDHDDSHAYASEESFALLLHGTQPKGTVAAKALSTLKGKGSYGKGKN